MERRPMRYAHGEGHTEVAYTGNNGELMTCGTDGDIRVWAGLEDDDPHTVCSGKASLVLLMTPTHLLVSTDSHSIQKYSMPEFNKDGELTKFTGDVTHLAFCEETNEVVCCSENMQVRVVSLKDNTVNVTLNHAGPVLSASICPIRRYCATSCGDGYCRVWNLENKSIEKILASIPKVNSFHSSKVLGRTSFEPPPGNRFAYGNNNKVVILDTDKWNSVAVLSHSQMESAVSQCLYSPCGKYLATSTVTGQIAIWRMEDKEYLIGLTEHETSRNICSMAWNPSAKSGELAFCDISGQLGIIINCFLEEGSDDGEDIDNMELVEIIERETQDQDLQKEIADSVTEEDEDNQNAISLDILRNKTLEPEDDASSLRRSRSRSRSVSRERARMAQPPFQPSSTPVNLDHRYMCWNDVGIVRSYSETDHSIEVEFHDSSTHHSIHLTNQKNHTMASLSKTVLVLACKAPSKLVCITLVGGSKEWSAPLPALEEVVCVTATDNLVAAATSMRYLRLFTPLGTQLHVISVGGDAVCLTGRGHILHLFYHATDPGVSDQNICMDTVQVNGIHPRVLNLNIKVAMTAGSVLRWAGSSEVGSAVTMDSEGIVRLYHYSSRTWIPICETQNHTKGVSDAYFIVSISEEMECIRAVLCRGSPYPLTAPCPTVAKLPLLLPFCDVNDEKGKIEEQFRKLLIIGNEDKLKRDKLEVVLKIFALASRSEVEQRAIEFMEILQEQSALVPAARYASRVGKLHLADRLASLSNDWDSNPPDAEPINTTTQLQVVDSLETQELDCSLILPAKEKKEEVVPLKPGPLRTFSGRNPFRKSASADSDNNGTNDKTRPLSLTDRQLVTPEATSKTDTISASEKPAPSENFMQWFARNKENLELEHIDLTPGELIKVGMKTFKSAQQQSTEDHTTVNGSTPKRKLSPSKEKLNEQDNGKAAPKQSKLSAFAFQKKST